MVLNPACRRPASCWGGGSLSFLIADRGAEQGGPTHREGGGPPAWARRKPRFGPGIESGG